MWTTAVSKDRCSKWQGCEHLRSTVAPIAWTCAVRISYALGESEQRLYSIATRREAPFFNDREHAALAWTEAVTLVSETGVPDDVFENARNQFSEKELVDLAMAVIAIIGWNRLAVSFRVVAGSHQPPSNAGRSEEKASH